MIPFGINDGLTQAAGTCDFVARLLIPPDFGDVESVEDRRRDMVSMVNVKQWKKETIEEDQKQKWVQKDGFMGYKLCVMLCVGQFLRGKGHYAFVCEPTLFFHTHKITRSPHCYLVPFLHTHIPTLLCGRSQFGNLTIYVSKSLLPQPHI